MACGLFALGVFFTGQQQENFQELSEFGMRPWRVTCESEARIYRLYSDNLSGWRSGPSLVQRHLTVLDEDGERLYYTVRFDPDRYETESVWAFTVGRDSRLFSGGRSDEVLYGDEALFAVHATFDALSVMTTDGGWIHLGCREG